MATLVCFALILLYIGILYSFDLKWELMTNPVVAHEDAMLSCHTNVALYNVINAAWMKASDGTFDKIAIANSSIDSLKYIVSFSIWKERIQYNLRIKDFEMADLMFQYKCVLEFQEYTAYLVLDDGNFIRLPKEDHIQQTFSLQNESVFIDIEMDHVFPKPTCHLVFEGNDYTKYLTVTTTNISLMNYNTKIQCLIPKNVHPICRFVTEIVCSVLTKQVNIQRGEINLCTDSVEDHSNVIVPTLIVLVTIVLAILVLIVWMKRTRRLVCNKKLISRNTSVEYFTNHNEDIT